jgi:ABC-type bacteriocin/lantibiotic exporter with double-glycine peptidase domain
VANEEKLVIRMPSRSTLHLIIQLWGHLSKRQKIQFKLLLCLTIVTALVELIGIGSIIPLLSLLFENESRGQGIIEKKLVEALSFLGFRYQTSVIVIGFIVITLICSLQRILLIWVQTKFAYNLGGDLGAKIFHNVLETPYVEYTRVNSSAPITAIINKTNAVIQNVLLPILNIMSSVIIITTLVSALTFLSPRLSIFTLVFFGLIYFLVTLVVKGKLKMDGQKMNSEQTKVLKILNESLGGYRDVILSGTKEVYVREYQKFDGPLRNSQARIQIIGTMPRYLIESIGMVGIVVAAYIYSKSNSEILIYVPLIGALAFGLQRLLPLLQQCYQAWSSMLGCKASLSELVDLLEKKNIKKSQPIKGVIQSVDFSNVIELKNLSFGYSNNGKPILEDINLSIKKGESIAVVGSTGSGKSTLSDILLGLLFPTNGQMLVDDLEITEKNAYLWHQKISHVPQSIFLSDQSILENIAIGIDLSKIDLDLVKKVARIAQIDKEIESMPEKYLTTVGERGMLLSGGQRQRIGIARALYRKSEILILDEATSALDKTTENLVLSKIKSLDPNMTIIMVTHHQSTFSHCSRVVQVKDRRVEPHHYVSY